MIEPALLAHDLDSNGRLLHSLALSIAQAEDLDTALAGVLHQLGEATGWATGEAWIPGAGGRIVRGSVWSALPQSLERFEEVTRSLTFEPGQGLVGLVWATANPVWVSNVQNSTLFLRADAARAAGLRTAAAIPVLAGTEVAAVLVFYHDEERPEDWRQIQLVSTVAAQLGLLVRRRQAEQALLRRTEELDRANEELNRFIWLASHDLNEPLRMMSIYAQLLAERLDGRLTPDEVGAVAFVTGGARRMHALLEDFRTYAEVGMRTARAEPVHLGQAVSRALAGLEPRIRELGAEIHCAPLPSVLAGQTEVVRVFEQLIANALTYQHPGTTPRVAVTARAEGDGAWQVMVHDNGIGIPPEHMDRVFEVFHRVHDRDAYPGTGIGLAICRKIVETYGGRIWLESGADGGSVVSFVLPGA